MPWFSSNCGFTHATVVGAAIGRPPKMVHFRISRRIRQAPLPPGGPNWDDILQKTLKEIKELAKKNAKGYKEIYKLLTDGRFNR